MWDAGPELWVVLRHIRWRGLGEMNVKNEAAICVWKLTYEKIDF